MKLSIIISISVLLMGVIFCCYGVSSSSGSRPGFSITLGMSKNTCYVREEVELELSIESELTTVDIGFSKYDLNLPAFFLAEILPNEVGAKKARIRRRVVPLLSGTFLIGPAKLYTTVFIPGAAGGELRSATLVSNEFRMRVIPLPEVDGRKGTKCPVGDYSFSAIADRESVRVGESVLFSYELSGKGSMRTFSIPMVKDSGLFSVSSIQGQKVTEDSETGIRKMVYTQEVVPLSSSISKVPSIKFVFFDPEKRDYVSIEQGPFPLSIVSSGGTDDVQDGGIAEDTDNDVRETTGIKDIRPEAGNIRSETVWTIYTPVFWWIQGIPLASIILSAAYVMYRRRIDSVLIHNYKRAYPRAKKAGKRAKKLLKSGDVEGCFNMLPRIIAGYVGDKLNIPSGGMTNSEILRHVGEHTHRKRFILQLETLLRFINQLRYTKNDLDMKKVRKWLKTTEKVLHWMEWHRVFRHAEREYIRALSEEMA